MQVKSLSENQSCHLLCPQGSLGVQVEKQTPLRVNLEPTLGRKGLSDMKPHQQVEAALVLAGCVTQLFVFTVPPFSFTLKYNNHSQPFYHICSPNGKT